MTLFLLVLLAALAFEYINGFHDAANAIATVVSTRVLTPRQAILMAAVFNLVGASMGTAVASTVGKGLVDTHFVTMGTLLAALAAAILWGLLTWWLGLPSSSSHALIGGLCGAALASAHNDWSALRWNVHDPAKHTVDGLWPKVVLPMISSPLIGFAMGMALMGLILVAFFWITPNAAGRVFGKLQLVSAAAMAFSHGSNDAQKTMGLITLALVTGTNAKIFDGMPGWLGFLRVPVFHDVPAWVVYTCALTMAAGTAGGGYRIIRTMGHKMVRLQPVHGFAAETAAAAVIHFATVLGIPVSTTHVISSAIMGVGATKRPGAVKWGVVGRMVWAWVLTLPVTALVGYAAYRLF